MLETGLNAPEENTPAKSSNCCVAEENYQCKQNANSEPGLK
jgi:hypothetical protein